MDSAEVGSPLPADGSSEGGGPDVRVRWVEHGPAATSALVEEVRTAKGDDRLARVTVVAPTKVSGLGLRRHLSGLPGGSVGVSHLVLAQLAEQLAARRLAVDGREPLTPAVRAELVREALRRTPGTLGELAGHTATATALEETVVAMRQATAVEGEDDLLARLEEEGPLRATLAGAYRTYRGLAGPLTYDEHDLALSAIDAVGREPGLLDEVGPIIVHLPARATPAAGRLLQSLAAHVPVTVLLGATGDPQADGVSAAIGRRLAGRPVEAPPPPAAARPPVEVIVAADAEEEVREAARLVARALHAGHDLARVAVLYRAQEPYATLAHEVLDAEGIPHNGPTERRLVQTMAGRFLWDLWQWYLDGRPRTGLFDLLGSVPVVHEGGRVPAERWDRLARAARVLGGDHWDLRLAGAIGGNEQRLATGEAPEWLQRRLATENEDLAALRSFVLDLTDALQPPDQRTWAAWAAWATGLLDRYLGDARGRWPEVDRDAEPRVRAAVAALARLDDLRSELGADAPVDEAEVRAALALALDEAAARVGRAGVGVYVGPIGTAGALDADHVVLLGMVEGQYPPRPRTRAFLPDAVVEELRDPTPTTPHARAAAALPVASDEVAAVRHALARVRAGSARVTATVPRADRRAQRATLPAPWLLDLVSEQHGKRVSVEDLLAPDPTVTGVRAVASARAGLLDAEVPAGRRELRLRLLAEQVGAGGVLADDPIVASEPPLRLGVRVQVARRSDVFTPWDGHVTGQQEALREAMERTRSPNALAHYGSCPRRFLFAEILRVSSQDEPRRWLDVDALDRGNATHETLEDWVAEQLPGAAPPPDGAAAVGSEERLVELLEERLAVLEATGRIGLPALWHQEKERMRRRLRVWFGQQAAHRSALGVEPIAVEQPFGMADDGSALEVETAAGVTLRFRGYIDRVDASPDGSTVVVTDYKTSRPDTYRGLADDVALSGTELQLPVYGLAAARSHPDADIQIGYWHIHDLVKREPNLVVFDEGARARTQEVLDTIADAALAGVFPADPGAEKTFPRTTFVNCHWCPFDRICPSHAERIRAAGRDLDSPPVTRRLLPLVQSGLGADDEEVDR